MIVSSSPDGVAESAAVGLDANDGAGVCAGRSTRVARNVNKKAAIALGTMRDRSEACGKRCEDASHSKALRAKSTETLAAFRASFGSAHASSRRF